MSVCVCRVVRSSKLDWVVSRRPVEQFIGPRTWAGVLDRQGGCASTWGSANASAPVTQKCLKQLKSRKGTRLSLLMFYVSPVHRCCLQRLSSASFCDCAHWPGTGITRFLHWVPAARQQEFMGQVS